MFTSTLARLEVTARRSDFDRAHEIAAETIRAGLEAGIPIAEFDRGEIFDPADGRRLGVWLLPEGVPPNPVLLDLRRRAGGVRAMKDFMRHEFFWRCTAAEYIHARRVIMRLIAVSA